MCGIVAVYGDADAREGERMLARLHHRGPDDWGTVQAGPSWLGHRRLSIVDVDGGHQPLSTADGALHMVGNGEIYNHADIRPGLTTRCRSDSDNEVALHLVDERGPAALTALRGMYALAIAGEDGRFVVARDPVGIKPLYWAQQDGAVRFASEVGAFPLGWRPFVEVFPPGHYWTPDSGVVAFASPDRLEPQIAFSDLSPVPPRDSPPAVLDALRDTIITAVERRMMADVPVGVFLSGGLDSSLIAAVAARHTAREGARLHTFAVGTAGSPDLAAARLVAEHLGTDHHERIYTPDEAIAVLPEVIGAMESYEPSLVRSAVPNYLLAELAARHVSTSWRSPRDRHTQHSGESPRWRPDDSRLKVVLTGEGADELFAGYEYLRAITDADGLHTELLRTVAGLHNLNLQRCDRMTMAHSLEARVPFLDLDVIGLALALPAAWKLPAPEPHPRMEKHVLREAFSDWLPAEIVWREKLQFGDGSGATAALGDRIAVTVSDAELVAAQTTLTPPPRTREELAYRRLFEARLEGVRADRLIGRFATA